MRNAPLGLNYTILKERPFRVCTPLIPINRNFPAIAGQATPFRVPLKGVYYQAKGLTAFAWGRTPWENVRNNGQSPEGATRCCFIYCPEPFRFVPPRWGSGTNIVDALFSRGCTPSYFGTPRWGSGTNRSYTYLLGFHPNSRGFTVPCPDLSGS